MMEYASLIDTALLAGIFWRMGGWSVRLKAVEDWIFQRQQEKQHARSNC
jgi:hypothetical protein